MSTTSTQRPFFDHLLRRVGEGVCFCCAPQPVKEAAPPAKEAAPPSKEAAPPPQEAAPPAADQKNQEPQALEEFKVVDISPEQDQSLLLRELEVEDPEAQLPCDGSEVQVEMEIAMHPEGADVHSLPLIVVKQCKLRIGSGNPTMPEELELAIPKLKKGTVAEVECKSFGAFGDVPALPQWKDLQPMRGEHVVIRLRIVEMEELSLASLDGPQRLAYAKGRKEAGSSYFRRERFQAALERYSLGAEMLNFVEDLQDGPLLSEAKETLMLCELNAAMCLLKLGRWREAESVCSEVLRSHPENEKALFRRAKACVEQGDGDRAVRDLQKVLDLNPSNVEAQRLLLRARRESRGTNCEKQLYTKMLNK